VDPFLILFVGVMVVAAGILWLRLDAFLALLLGALAVGLLTTGEGAVGSRIAAAFGTTAGQIGIMIALATIIGTCLLESGAADRVVRSALATFGEKRAPFGFMVAGFTLGVPVFFDTVFYLMIPLAKAMAARTGRHYALYVMSVGSGASIAHSLVPPTPGPLFVADRLGVDIGVMMIAGGVIGGVATAAGMVYAYWCDRRWPVPLRETTEASLADLQALTQRPDSDLPPLWLSLLPILLPVVLIGGASAIGTAPWAPATLTWILRSLGERNIALALATGIALLTLTRQLNGDRKRLGSLIHSALSSGGLIVLITAAGGSFGAMLQASGIGDRIAGLAAVHALPILPLAFFTTALVRTAQGSATVAMFTAVGMLTSLADPAVLGFHPVYLALAIGFGSKPFSWMNDSGFWVITRMSGWKPAETMRNFSVLISIDAVIGLMVTMIAARLVPLL
jgi:GntP family gluconate:H+ symporter